MFHDEIELRVKLNLPSGHIHSGSISTYIICEKTPSHIFLPFILERVRELDQCSCRRLILCMLELSLGHMILFLVARGFEVSMSLVI